jgi:hypothetical protein
VLENDAEAPLNADEPICAEPSRNVTEPDGDTVPDWGVTLAVNMTFCPETILVEDAAREVAVAAGTMIAGVKTKTVAEYDGKL